MWLVFQQAMWPYTRPWSVTRTLVGPDRLGLVNHSDGGSRGTCAATCSAQVVVSGEMPAAAVKVAKRCFSWFWWGVSAAVVVDGSCSSWSGSGTDWMKADPAPSR